MFKDSKKSIDIGSSAESAAEKYLKQQGLAPVTRNFRSQRGEIDLIMEDRDVLVFVEVRYRKQHRFGSGAESVTYHKQQKLILAAHYFLTQHKKYRNRNCRFDVLSITTDPQPEGHQLQFNWIKNAFET